MLCMHFASTSCKPTSGYTKRLHSESWEKVRVLVSNVPSPSTEHVVMKRSSFAIRLGPFVKVAVVILLAALGSFGAEILPRISPAYAARIGEDRPELTFKGYMPELDGGVAWLNSAPLKTRSLRGKVVLINLWTYTCINSLRPMPYVKEWSQKYKDAGLVVIGVHTPEFSFEREQTNVATATREHNATYPVVMDNNYQIWRAFSNNYWPAFDLIDGKGQIRYEHFGEGDYGTM